MSSTRRSRCARLLVLLQLLSSAVLLSQADPALLPFSDCFSGNASRKLNISTVYGQVFDGDEQPHTHLNLTIFGQSSQEIVGFSGDSTSLATLFTTTSVLTFNAYTNSTYFCSALRPPSPLSAPDNTTGTYCPIPSGEFALSSLIPWGDDRALTTLTTRLRAVNPFSQEVLCLEVSTLPLDPSPHSPYGRARAIFWFTVAMTIAYWAVVGIARIVAAWGRGTSRTSRGLWARAQSAGFILASAISGERLATSPALLRFSTPSMRDIIFHTQWCATLAMVAVEWPSFAYPLLTQTAWSTLTFNVTLTTSGRDGLHWDTLATPPFNPPSAFADQVADPTSPLFIDTSVPNTIFTLPSDAHHGMEKFAYTIGLSPQELFPTCLILFLAIIAGTIAISVLILLLDRFALFVSSPFNRQPSVPPSRLAGTRSPGFTSKDMLDVPTSGTLSGNPLNPDDNKSLNGHGQGLFTTPSRFALAGGAAKKKSWWRRALHIRPNINSFHGSVLHGNLVRILVLFHLPISIFSCYEMTLPRTRPEFAPPISSVVLAGLSFAIFSLFIPVALVLRMTTTSTNKLYEETRTLLCLGPLYNHYRHGSQMFASLLFASNVAFGVAIGCGQNSGTTQAVVILVIEVISALVTSMWLPWGTGASMGLISFLFCVARIVIAVLLVILTPTISIGTGPGGWVAYGIIVVLALVYVALVLMLFVKLFEAVVRIFGRVSFDRSTHVVDTGLLGACGLLGCCGSRRSRRRRPRRHRYKATEVRRGSNAASEQSSYLPPHVFHAEGSGSRKGSMHSGPPPSVLKPEHAFRPYKEESDDENGYIMGAWQPFPRPGYSSLANSPGSSSSQQAPRSTGFSRVGGGRAHIDTPYAIASESTQTFPTLAHQPGSVPVFDDDDSPPPSLSNIARYQDSNLPPGAMQPKHVRKRSQTAIVEDASALVLSVPNTTPSNDAAGKRATLLLSSPDDDDDSDATPQKRKPWYHLRRHRPHSSEGNAPPPPAQLEEGTLEGTSEAQPTRSFVVIRKPQVSPGRSQFSAASSSSNPVTPTQATFSHQSGDPRSANATA
ncbi:hypothetical protein HGRIS_010095 [Hohenbuehelia grisea]|uniref:TRP C-terminal domain-containing protein n=1 Tax=Hohenbuehelia grisea TaxID=104357 RepID=A0ABR3J3A4_9AGAR